MLKRGLASQVVLPRRHYPDGYSVQVQGAKVVSAPSSRRLILVNCRGEHDVTLRVAPGAGAPDQSCATAAPERRRDRRPSSS